MHASSATSGPTRLRLEVARFLLDLLEVQARLLSAAATVSSEAARRLATGWRVVPALAGAGLTVALCTGACGPFDLSCKIDAWQSGWLEGLNATFATVTQSMIEGVFTSSLSTLGTASWNVGITTVNRLGAVMAIVVVALCAVQITMTLFARQRSGVTRAVFGALLAWPICTASVWLAIRLVTVADGLADVVIESSTALTSLSRLVDLAWVGSVVTGNPVGVAMVGLFFLFMVFIPTVLLTFVMAFRNYALVVAVAVAPVSLMVWGLDALRGMGRGWVKVITALVLTKPVMAIAILIAGEMVGAGLATGGIGPFMTGVVGLFAAAFAPFLAMGMVTGAMAIGDGVAARGVEQRLGRAGAAAAGRGAAGLGRLGWQKGKPHLAQATSGVTSRLGTSINSFFGTSAGSQAPGSQVAPGGAPPSSGPAGSGRRAGEAAGGAAGEGVGGAAGGVAGSVVPGVGTVAGSQVGRQAGRAAGQSAGGAAGGAMDRTTHGEGVGGPGQASAGTMPSRPPGAGPGGRQPGRAASEGTGGLAGSTAPAVSGSVGGRGPDRPVGQSAGGVAGDFVGQPDAGEEAPGATGQRDEGRTPGRQAGVEAPVPQGSRRESTVPGGAGLMEGLG